MQATETLCHLSITDIKKRFCNIWFFCKNKACVNCGKENATTLTWLLKGLHVYFRYLVVRKTSTNMGSFIGHAVPGAFFTLGALWWTFNIFWRYFTAHFNQLHHGAKKKGGRGAYRNTVSFSCCDIICPKMFVLILLLRMFSIRLIFLVLWNL